jgi:hypothetical protein
LYRGHDFFLKKAVGGIPFIKEINELHTITTDGIDFTASGEQVSHRNPHTSPPPWKSSSLTTATQSTKAPNQQARRTKAAKQPEHKTKATKHPETKNMPHPPSDSGRHTDQGCHAKPVAGARQPDEGEQR